MVGTGGESAAGVGVAFCLRLPSSAPDLGSMSDETGSATDSAEAEYHDRLRRALGDDYELRELIGRGGFGSVYAAWDKRLERDVAVKALRHDLFPTPDILKRFEREAKAVAKLRHPNILPIYTVGEGDGIAYMVMPLVEGESLRTLLEREGKLSEGEAVRITVGVARALEAAHRHGFVHRDVKPENVMLDGEDRQVLLMDFGVARVVTTDEPGLTGTGMIIGSPSYMSPEQARGDSDIDHRADIYQLGAVAYEMLSGARPFKAKNLHELIYRHVTEDPTPLRTIAPEVSEQVSDVIMGCLAKDREKRIESAQRVAATLATVAQVADSSVTASRAPGGYENGVGVGTRLGFGILMLVYLSMGISWFEQVASDVRDASELGQGFYQLAVLLAPIRIIANVLIVGGLGLLLWNVGLHYRRHRQVRRAIGLSFARPSGAAFSIALAIAGLLAVVHLLYIMPTLQRMAASVGATLPLSARVVIHTSRIMQDGWWIAAALIVAVWLFQSYRRRGRAGA